MYIYVYIGQEEAGAAAGRDGYEDGADGGGAVVGGAARRGGRAQARQGCARDPRQGQPRGQAGLASLSVIDAAT